MICERCQHSIYECEGWEWFLVGCKKEEDFKLLIATNNQQIHFFEEETGKHFEGNFFKNIKDLERQNDKQINY